MQPYKDWITFCWIRNLAYFESKICPIVDMTSFTFFIPCSPGRVSCWLFRSSIVIVVVSWWRRCGPCTTNLNWGVKFVSEDFTRGHWGFKSHWSSYRWASCRSRRTSCRYFCIVVETHQMIISLDFKNLFQQSINLWYQMSHMICVDICCP